jgi:Ca2+-binding RTX toxin-like protein
MGIDSETILVTNVAPQTLTITGPNLAVPGQYLTYTGTFTDPGEADLPTENEQWTVMQGATTVATGTGPTLNFIAPATGTYSIRYRVTDKDGGTTSLVKPITIKSVALQTDPTDSTRKALYVGGTTGDDIITVKPKDNLGTVTVTIGGIVQGSFKPTGPVIVLGQGGHDHIILQDNGLLNMNVPAIVYGGDGNDIIDASESTAGNILMGGAGDDDLIGSSANDLLIGGTGSDELTGNGGDDLMIGALVPSYVDEATQYLDYEGSDNSLNNWNSSSDRTTSDFDTLVTDDATEDSFISSGDGGTDLLYGHNTGTDQDIFDMDAGDNLFGV